MQHHRQAHTRSPSRTARVAAAVALLLIGSVLALTVQPSSAVAAISSGSIAGSVTDTSGRELAGITVSLRWGNVVVRQVSTDDTGGYRFDDLTPDTYYQVGFSDPQLIYAPEWFDDLMGPGSYLTVTGGAVTDGVDASLDLAGRIRGRVTTASGAPDTRAVVTVYWRETPSIYGFMGSYDVDQDGRYVLGLKAATYVLYFSDAQSGLSEFWDNQPGAAWEPSRGTPLTVSSEQDLSGIDAVLDGFDVENTALPVISGSPRVGEPLSASPGTWHPADVAVSYQWVVGDVPVSMGLPQTAVYVPTSADVGKVVRVVVTASHPGWTTGTAVSAATAVVQPQPQPPEVSPEAVAVLVRPRIKGVARLGETVRVSHGAWQPQGVRCSYQWYSGHQMIRGATNRRLVMTRALLGKHLRVRVNSSAVGYTSLVIWTRRSPRVGR